MTRWRLSLGEYYTKVVLITEVNNNAAVAFSRLDKTDSLDDLVTRGEKKKYLEYIKVQETNRCMFMLESNFKEVRFDNNVLVKISDTQEELPFLLDLQSMREAQLNDNRLMLVIQTCINNSEEGNSKGIELIHQ